MFKMSMHRADPPQDDVALTKDGGPYILSADAPKEIVDVEGTCQRLLDAE